MKSYIFVDVDGTLLYEGVIIPKSAVTAIQTARKNGHAVYLSTGRPKGELSSEILAIGYDGFVCAGGAYVENHGQVLYENELNPEKLDKLLPWMDENNIGYALQSAKNTYLSNLAAKNLHSVFGISKDSELERVEALMGQFQSMDSFTHDVPVHKFCFYAWNQDAKQLIRDKFQDYEVIFHHGPDLEVYGEVTNKGIVKSHGIQLILEAEKAHISQSVAYGDSPNDMEMIKMAALGICMENGVDALKQVADEICPAVDDDGLYKSFRQHGFL